MSRRARPGAAAAALGVATALAIGATARAADPALVFEPASGQVLHHEAAHQRWHPASLTKLMTLYVVFEEIGAGRLAMGEPLTVSKHAAGQPATRLGLRAGATLDVEQAVLAVIIASANDAAVVLAERVAGSEASFAQRMTSTAGRLGMTRSVFRNASGLPDRAQVSTARDIGALASRLLADHPDLYPLFASRSMRFGKRTFRSSNRLLESYAGSDGLKTGFTCGAGFNLAASAVRDGRRLVAVALGSTNSWRRNRRVAELLDAGFEGLASQAGDVLLESIPMSDDTAAAPAPVRLSSEACASLARPKLEPGNLPGWGVLLGVYGSRAAAEKTARLARKRLRGVTGRALPVILERRFERGTSFKALLVGFEPTAAGKACQALWAADITCVAQSPTLINNPNYAVR